MEVSTVSPRHASLTEGDHLCETDVTSVAIHSVTLLICLCGLAGIGAVIGLLNLEILNYSIFELAFTDFLFLLFVFPPTLLFLVEDMSCSPIVPLMYMSFISQLSAVSYYWGLSRLMWSRNMLYMQKFYKLCCHCDISLRLLWMMESVQSGAFFALFAVIPVMTFLCPSHEQEHCRAAFISMYAVVLLLLPAPLVISRTVLLIKAKWGSQQQQSKRHNTAIVLIALFSLLLILGDFLQQLGYIIVSSHVVFLLICIHSSFKPFVYFLVGRCRRPCSMGSLRVSLQRVFEDQKKKPAHSNDAPRDTGV